MAACLAGLLALSGCVKIPLVNRGGQSAAEPAAEQPSPVTPRELLTAKLVNARGDSDTPAITVGKLIEFADRYLSCDCAGVRFARAWQRTAEGYLLATNSDAVGPLEFVCREPENDETRCFLTEIDRGSGAESLEKRFVPGAEFIRFIYENGVRCEPERPCP